MSQTIHLTGADAQGFSGGITRYLPVGSTAMVQQSTEANAQTVFRTAGTLSHLYVVVVANNRGATTVKTRKNAADGGQSVSIGSSTAGEFEDTTHTDTVTAGDKFDYQIVTGGGGNNFTISAFQLLYDSSSNTDVRLVGSGTQSQSAQATTFTPYGGANALEATEANASIKMRTAGTLKHLFAYVSSNGRTSTTTFQSRKNAGNGSMSFSVLTTQSGVFEDTTNTDTVAAGDTVCVEMLTGILTGAVVTEIVGATLVTTNGKSHLVCSAAGGVGLATGSATRYLLMSGTASFEATEANVQTKPKIAGTAQNLEIYIVTNGRSTAGTITMRKNGADSALTASITGSTTGFFEDTTHTVTMAAADTWNYKQTTGTGSGTTTVGFLSTVIDTTVATTPQHNYRSMLGVGP